MKTLLAVVGGIVVFGVLGLVCIGWLAGKNSSPPTSVDVMRGDVTVDPGMIKYYNFSVPENATDALVRGQFEAAGGSGNDIVACLATRIEFKNWENDHQSQCIYYSGQVTAGEIHTASLPPGDYTLGFSNAMSVITPKVVSGNVQLTYVP
jgi:hypothetical protein